MVAIYNGQLPVIFFPSLHCLWECLVVEEPLLAPRRALAVLGERRRSAEDVVSCLWPRLGLLCLGREEAVGCSQIQDLSLAESCLCRVPHWLLLAPDVHGSCESSQRQHLSSG